MFKKLRNKFLILNLITISVMMLISFTSIYIITYKDVQNDIFMELHKVSEKAADNTRRPNDGPQPFPPGQADPGQQRSIMFTAFIDADWNVKSISSFFDMDESVYSAAINTVKSRKADTGSFSQDGTSWAYIIKPMPDGYRVVFLDITSRHEILQNLIITFFIVALVTLIGIFFISRYFANKSIKPVKEAFDKQKQFIADASHELKTPLAVINTNVDVLLSNGDDSIKNQSKWLNYIKSESERMSKLTNDLLYLTQVDYSDIKMISTDFNLSDTVENVILTMEAVVFENSITLDYKIEPGLFINGNAEQIQQVIMILMDNAVKYTNSGGKINMNLKRGHNTAVLSITNTGDGISEEHLDKIFDRFYRTDKSRARKSGGYGLGLAIAKAIVEQNGGKISAKSTLNESTTFIVELPRISE